VRVSKPGTIHLWVLAGVPDGQSRIGVAVMTAAEARGGTPPNAAASAGAAPNADAPNGTPIRTIALTGAAPQRYDAGEWTLTDTGYQAIRLTAISRKGKFFANISALVMSGTALNGRTAYVPNDDGNFFYWGRRGPSVHLSYAVPPEIHASWFYNEVTVPVGEDVEGSYFMADGFTQGYFGMQVNGPEERHILFSVWSPYETDNPQSIPDSLKILLVRKGEGVHAGAFGNEGSGGQSYLNYMWKAGQTYRFLLRARPLPNRYTEFTAWFYAPELGQWRLIASFSRPQTRVWLTGLHSFLENFDPEQGNRTRYVLFNHQWVADENGVWTSIHRARFTGDNTARKGYRLDYAGGVLNQSFQLRNAGFFNDLVPLNTWFERPLVSPEEKPEVDLSKLP
jgi:hypothetical protein